MFQAICKRLSYSNIAATMALVFALTGGAFAATGHSGGSGFKVTASAAPATTAKTKTKTGPRGPAGPKGATGATGPAGAIGSAGPTGAAGAKGENGATGTVGPQGPEGKAGKEGKEGEEGTPGAKGETGSPWTAGGTLPSGSTETGAWGVDTSSPYTITTVSFPIPLASALDEHHVHFILSEGEEYVSPTKNNPTHPACLGSSAKPEATPGNFCVYTAFMRPEVLAPAFPTIEALVPPPPGANASAVGTATSGATLAFTLLESEPTGLRRAYGTWAVTAP
jgi:hypothetical protein